MRDLLTRETPTPVIIRVGKLEAMDSNIYDHSERYDDTKEILEEGKYWMGSKTANTRSNVSCQHQPHKPQYECDQ